MSAGGGERVKMCIHISKCFYWSVFLQIVHMEKITSSVPLEFKINVNL